MATVWMSEVKQLALDMALKDNEHAPTQDILARAQAFYEFLIEEPEDQG